MKHKILKLLILSISLLILINTQKTERNNKSACSISTISIPIGTNSPVMIYNARKDNEEWQLTVIEKENLENYDIKGNLFYSDKRSGESWYTNKDMDEKTFESMRDAFSLCRTLNTDNKRTKVYDNNRFYTKYRTQSLPQNLSLRVNNKATSFLQLQTKESFIDKDLQDSLDQLENSDFKNQEYHGPINDAYKQNRLLQREIKESYGLIPHHTMDFVMD